jgi:hypothetical protein
MATTEKSIIVAKVFDDDCDICKHMSKHDRATFEGFPEISYGEVNLDDVINHQNDYTKLTIYSCLENHALNSDYTIDLPVYVFLKKTGKYLTCHKGPATVLELRDIIKDVIETTTTNADD